MPRIFKIVLEFIRRMNKSNMKMVERIKKNNNIIIWTSGFEKTAIDESDIVESGIEKNDTVEY